MRKGYRWRVVICGLVVAAAAGPRLRAQTPHPEAQLLHPADGTAPAFEVASVKQTLAAEVFSFRLQPDRFIAQNAPLDRLIQFAYNVKSEHQVVNMPSWAGSARFDIDAKIGDSEVEAMKKLLPDQRFEQYRLMVQSLLSDRFEMRVKIETQELQVYALVVARNGPRMAPTSISPEQQRPQLPQLNFTSSGDLKAASVSMPFFAGWLSGRPDASGRIVVDATDLQGSYDFTLKWNPVEATSAPASGNQTSPGAIQLDDNRPMLFTAIQEQLGLKLKPQKAPVEVLVIDHVEQPSAN